MSAKKIVLTDEIMGDILKLYETAVMEHREAHDKDAEDIAYWQGRKDGTRIILALLLPERSFSALNESSPGFRTDKVTLLSELVERAYWLLNEVNADHKGKLKVHPLSWLNIRRWLEQYKFLQNKGTLPKEK